jgi:Tfp pilus assembly protein PilO
MAADQTQNNVLAKLSVREWLSIIGGLLVVAAVAGMGYSSLLSADTTQTTAIKANSAAMKRQDENSKQMVKTQNEANAEMQAIQLRLQAIEINQNTNTKKLDRNELMLQQLILMGELAMKGKDLGGVAYTVGPPTKKQTGW